MRGRRQVKRRIETIGFLSLATTLMALMAITVGCREAELAFEAEPRLSAPAPTRGLLQVDIDIVPEDWDELRGQHHDLRSVAIV